MITRKLLRVVRRSVMTGRESVPWLQQPLELNDPEVFKLTLKQNKFFFFQIFFEVLLHLFRYIKL